MLAVVDKLTGTAFMTTQLLPSGKTAVLFGATPLQGVVLTLVMLVLVVGVSQLTWRLVELPGQRLARRLAKPA